MIGKMAIAIDLCGFNPYISFQKHILFTMNYALSKMSKN